MCRVGDPGVGAKRWKPQPNEAPILDFTKPRPTPIPHEFAMNVPVSKKPPKKPAAQYSPTQRAQQQERPRVVRPNKHAASVVMTYSRIKRSPGFWGGLRMPNTASSLAERLGGASQLKHKYSATEANFMLIARASKDSLELSKRLPSKCTSGDMKHKRCFRVVRLETRDCADHNLT